MRKYVSYKVSFDWFLTHFHTTHHSNRKFWTLVEEDDIIGWELKLFRNEDSRQYSIQVEVLDPAEAEHPVPCGCQSAKCTLISALLQKEDEEFQ